MVVCEGRVEGRVERLHQQPNLVADPKTRHLMLRDMAFAHNEYKKRSQLIHISI